MRILNEATIVTCLLICLGTGSLAITCLSCGDEGQRDLSSCSNVIECEADHTCYVEQVLSMSDFTPRFKAGCRDLNQCNLIKCNVDAARNLSAGVTQVPHSSSHKRALTVCTECCYNDTCNTKGCGGKIEILNAKRERLLQCFDCTKLRQGSKPCMRFTTCQSGESCASEFKPHDDGDPYYQLRCLKSGFCEMLKQVAIQNNKKPDTNCCDDYLCNQNPFSITDLNITDHFQTIPCPTDIVRTSTTTTPKPVTAQPLPITAKPAASTTKPAASTAKPAATTAKPAATTAKPQTSTVKLQTTTVKPQTTTVKPTTVKPTTVKPTTVKPTTTTQTTTTTTTPAPTTVAAGGTASRQCQICDGPPEICEQAFIETTCTYPDNYCINKLTNTRLGARTMDRKCGNLEECKREWYQGTSDNDRCLNFDPRYVQTLDFDCTFCCVTDNCNIPVVPNPATLYSP